jgi:Protein of unknown function (DUF732)
MDIDRITHPLRLAKKSHQPRSGKGCAMNVISCINRRRGSLVIGKVLVGAAAAVISVGLAAPAGASPVPQPHTAPNFLAAARAAGITGTDPAMLGDGYNVCWQLWNQHASGIQVAAGLVRDHPQLTNDQAAHFVLAAYNDLCPVPGAYDYWAYSTS